MKRPAPKRVAMASLNGRRCCESSTGWIPPTGIEREGTRDIWLRRMRPRRPHLGSSLRQCRPRGHGGMEPARHGREMMVSEVAGLRALPSAQAVADACDFVWITVSDDAIGPVSDGIAWSARHKVVHCSGATEVLALAAAKKAGAAIGGFHPLQMFTNPAVALKGLPGCTVGIEADSALYESLNRLALDIGCAPVLVPAGDRALYHASAYYVGPFLIALLAEGVALCVK